MSGEEHCPFCNLESKASFKYLDSLLYERVNDGGMRKKIREAKGFCREHARELKELGGSLGLAIIYDELLGRLLTLLESMKSGYPPRIYERMLSELASWNSHEDCPACRFVRQSTERYIDTFVYFLDDEQMRNAFEDSAGLCIPHFEMVLLRTAEAEKREYLITVETGKLKELEKNLSEFMRKQDYRFEHEPLLKEEAVSWIRTIDIMTGGRAGR